MKKLFKTFWEWLWCNHQWRYIDTVQDQDLRSGYKFWSERHVCRKCGRVMTTELRDQQR